MATLTETAYYTRKAINWGIFGVIAIIILKLTLDLTISTWHRIHPPPPPAPTVAFGKLPAIKFPPAPSGAGLASPSAKLNFALETVEGGPPITPPTGTVFFISKQTVNLLSFSRARQFANQLGFGGEPKEESQTIYYWQDEKNPLRTLTLDIVTYNLKIAYDYTADLGLFSEKSLPSQDQAITEARNFLQNQGLSSPAILNGEAKVSYWQLLGNSLTQTTSYSAADAVRVDLGRENIQEMKLFSPYPPQELVDFIFSGSSNQTSRILELSYKFWPIETEQSATYPLKTASQAWEELKNGGGYIAKIGQGQIVVVRKISLAYFYPEDFQNFLQPIFVFEGDPDFIAYVAAISPAWAAP